MTVKVGIMSFAHLHADSYALCLKQHPQAELVGVADHDQARAKAKSAPVRDAGVQQLRSAFGV
jgi:UDP-N-acetylglucosamine 3-dehydrogenase